MIFLRSALALSLALGVVVPNAFSQEPTCKQKDAVYVDEDEVYSLRFTEPKGGLGISSNYFEVVPKDHQVPLNGWVIWSGETPLPEATLGYKCPEGDITGDELKKCTVWSGIVYQLLEDRQADVLGPEDDPAAKALLLPGFGKALRASGAWGKNGFEKAPWDVFQLSGCAKSE